MQTRDEVLAELREAFLDFLADGDFREEPDADVNDAGQTVDHTRYFINASRHTFGDFCDALGFTRRFDQSWGDVVNEAIGGAA